MDQLDDLSKHVNNLISELSGIIQRLDVDITDAKKAVSFGQVKEIENSIARMKRRGLPIPSELKALKIKLLSEHEQHQARIDLQQRIKDRIGELLGHERSESKRAPIELKSGRLSRRKPYNYEKPLGTKGYSNFEDYLVPVIQLMWRGLDHKAAFRRIAQRLDVRYNTVSAHCTRSLGLTTEEFINKVNSGAIANVLENKYPDKCQEVSELLKTR